MTKTPHELWAEAAGDGDRYIALMIEHGHLIARCEHLTPEGIRCDRAADHPGLHTYGRDIFGHPVGRS